MGFIDWLLEPIRETYRLAPAEPSPGVESPGVESPGAAALHSTGAAVPPSTFDALEAQRLAAFRHRRRSLLVGVPMLLMLSAGTAFAYTALGTERDEAIGRGVMVLLVGALVLGAIAHVGFWIFRQTAKQRVLTVLAAKQGLEYRIDGVDRETLEPFEDHGLFGASTHGGRTEDGFSGMVHGVEFLLFEARRESVSRSEKSSTRTLVFHGLCLRLSFPKRFSATTRVLSDRGLLNTLHGKGSDDSLARVRLEDAEFERHFEVVSSDQVEARYLLTPALMERLVAAQRVLGKRTRLRAGFHDRSMLLTLDTRRNRPVWSRLRGKLNPLHHFEILDLRKPVDQMEIIRRFEQEMALCQDLVRTLQLNMSTRV